MKAHGTRKPSSSGFWMFDTPCTQALWEAVMGQNPSEFKGPDRPVEQRELGAMSGIPQAFEREVYGASN